MKNALSGQSGRIIKTVSKLASATFLSRILGLVRELVMAYYFGASKFTDAFLVAYRIPNLFRDLLAEGAFSQAFVPVLVNKLSKDQEAARILCWKAFCWLFIITGVLGSLMFVLAPQLVGLFAPSFAKDPELWETSLSLTRIMLPYLVSVSLAAMLMASLNALKYFFLPAVSSLFFNVTMIASTLIGYPLLTAKGINPVYALAMGVLLGGVVQFLMQFALILKAGFGPKRVSLAIDEDLKKIGKNLSVGFLGFAAVQINLLVNTILATSSGLGAVSWLTYAFRLFQFPVGIFAVSLSNSHLVYFSEAWKKNDKEQALSCLKMSANFNFLLLIPIAVITYIMAPFLVNLVFERGEFDTVDTLKTSLALSLYAVGIPFYGFYKILGPTFFTLDKPQVPLYGTAIAVLINIAFSTQMIPIMGFSALALGTTLGSLGSVAFQLSYLCKKLEIPYSFFLGLDLVKVILASTLMGYFLMYIQGEWLSLTLSTFELAWKSGLVMLLCVILYAILSILLSPKKFFSK